MAQVAFSVFNLLDIGLINYNNTRDVLTTVLVRAVISIMSFSICVCVCVFVPLLFVN